MTHLPPNQMARKEKNWSIKTYVGKIAHLPPNQMASDKNSVYNKHKMSHEIFPCISI